VGATNTAIDYAAFWALISFTPLSPVFANIISFSIGAANSFLLNATITFGDCEKIMSSFRRVQRFIAVTLLCLVISTSVLAVCMQFVHLLIAKTVSMIVSFTFGYLLCIRFVFRMQPWNSFP
jgi:putative flippase GtrA